MSQLVKLDSELADQVPLYPDIDIPMIVVHGKSDGRVHYATKAPVLTATVSGASLIKLDGIAHEPNVVSDTEIRKALSGFLASQ